MLTSNTWLGLTLGISIFLISSITPPHTTSVEQRLNYYTEMLIALAPPYTWGGFFGILSGDCSGQMYWIFYRAGLPVLRMTAKQMWLGGWAGVKYNDKEAIWGQSKFPDLVFFTFSPSRPAGHVGIVRTNLPNQITFAEASSSAKIFKETVMTLKDGRGKATIGILRPKLIYGGTR